MNSKEIKIIGTEEWCGFGAFGIPAIKARIDSGAKTSALQAHNLNLFLKNKEEWVRFEVYPMQENRNISILCEAQIHAKRHIKSSTGVSEQRIVIKTPITIGENTFEVEITLADRSTMEFRMLLGREALIDRYLVDSSKSFLQSEYKEEEIAKEYIAFTQEKSTLKIGLLSSNPESYSNQRIMQVGKAKGHEMVFLDVEKIHIKLDKNQPKIYYDSDEVLDNFDAIIPRIKPSFTTYACAIIRQFASMGVYRLNSAISISQSRDKLLSTQLFAKNNLNIPATAFTKSHLNGLDLTKMLEEYSLLIKPLENKKAKDFILIENQKDIEILLNSFKNTNDNILVHAFRKEENEKFIRCFVINGKVLASMQIQSADELLIPIKTTTEERKLASKAAKILSLSVAEIDIIRSSKEPMLLDVNPSLELEEIESTTGKNIANLMIEAIEKKLLVGVK